MVLVILAPHSDWREPFIKYLTNADVPANKTKMKRLICHSKHYVLVDGKLMWKNAKEELLQKCISQEDGVALLQEIHAGSCGNHAVSRSLVGKAFRAGFYWPSVVADVETLVPLCEGCQFFTKQIHVLAQALQTIPASWPFAYGGPDMIGPFRKAPGRFRWVYVAIDNFSKWIEYKPLVQSTAKKVAELFNDIIHRFGISNSIITDLGSTFTGSDF